MKKLIFTVLTALLITTSSQAQETPTALQKGKWMVETNLNPFSSIGTTGLLYNKTKNTEAWGIGGETGYFISDQFAIKAGIGYNKSELDININEEYFTRKTTSFSYKIGAKYYIINAIPVQIDLGGIKENNAKQNLIFGGQVGYAWFINNNIIIEPQIRYNLSNGDNGYQNDNVFSARIGFSLHF